MSLTAEPSVGQTVCEHCGSPLGTDQEWCHECGAAGTIIHRPPDWRIPVALVAAVVLAGLVAFAIVLINLSDQPGQAPASTVTRQAAQPRAASSTAAPKPIGSWAIGLPGFTVQLASSPDESTAHEAAVGLSVSGVRVGLLDSSQHPDMTPGKWIVFTGRYPTRGAAKARARELRAKGFANARVRLVGRAGTG